MRLPNGLGDTLPAFAVPRPVVIREDVGQSDFARSMAAAVVEATATGHPVNFSGWSGQGRGGSIINATAQPNGEVRSSEGVLLRPATEIPAPREVLPIAPTVAQHAAETWGRHRHTERDSPGVEVYTDVTYTLLGGIRTALVEHRTGTPLHEAPGTPNPIALVNRAIIDAAHSNLAIDLDPVHVVAVDAVALGVVVGGLIGHCYARPVVGALIGGIVIAVIGYGASVAVVGALGSNG